MLQRLNQLQAECLERALEARASAEASTEPSARQFFMDMEDRWLLLARSYEYAARLDAFIDSRKVGSVAKPHANDDGEREAARMTPREVQVLQLSATGYSYRQVAAACEITT